MSFFLEKVLVPIVTGLVVLLMGTNPWKFDHVQRISGAIALIAAAVFIARTANSTKSLNQESSSSPKPAIAAVPESMPRAKTTKEIPKNPEPPTAQYVSSHEQSGGQTAGSITNNFQGPVYVEKVELRPDDWQKIFKLDQRDMLNSREQSSISPQDSLKKHLANNGVSQEEFDAWILSKRKASDRRANAEAAYMSRDFKEAARRYRELAQEARETGSLAERQNSSSAADEGDFLYLAGLSYRAIGDLREGLTSFDASARLIDVRSRPLSWGLAQNMIGVSNAEMADRKSGVEALDLRRSAIAAYNRALTVLTVNEFQEEWCRVKANLAHALAMQAKHHQGKTRDELLKQSENAFREVLSLGPQQSNPNARGGILLNLSNVLQMQADSLSPDAAQVMLKEAAKHAGDAVLCFNRQSETGNWIIAQNTLGLALRNLADIAIDDDPKPFLQQSRAAFSDALDQTDAKEDSQLWGKLQSNLALVLSRIAGFDPPHAIQLLDEAIARGEAALIVNNRTIAPELWGSTHSILGQVCSAYHEYGSPSDVRWLKRSISEYEQALEVYTRDAYPVRYATISLALATNLAIHSKTEGATAEGLIKSLSILRSVAGIFTREVAPQRYADIQLQIATRLELLSITDPENAQLLKQESASAFAEAINAMQSNRPNR